ncbi:hypothetical protein SAMN02745166_01680 [Prosthecobacter debontii]|uniref:Uncharacterized protein n=1 Tax=Prosthecobacter debontii TaxID=48467 RepID=A0A1T4XL18_9BACT|nr:hypothetical protein SAMN02745166_01680 [Prosthecobacter debontii]
MLAVLRLERSSDALVRCFLIGTSPVSRDCGMRLVRSFGFEGRALGPPKSRRFLSYQKTAQARGLEREYGGAYSPDFPRTGESLKDDVV